MEAPEEHVEDEDEDPHDDVVVAEETERVDVGLRLDLEIGRDDEEQRVGEGEGHVESLHTWSVDKACRLSCATVL